MSENVVNMYDIDPHVAEIYDQVDTHTDDVELLRRLLRGSRHLRILEPFCGTGRILLPLAMDGHSVVGLDQAGTMLDRARAKLHKCPDDVRRRVSLVQCDLTASEWPRGFDVVVLGGNCLYELATPTEQAGCIESAVSALRGGGHIFVDNDHMEGDLDRSWQQTGVSQGFPTGLCSDGARVEGSGEAVWWDVGRRLIRFRRRTKVVLSNGAVLEREYVQQKHPVSAEEVRTWLGCHGFAILRSYGDYAGTPYDSTSQRAIFWGKKPEQAEAQRRPGAATGAV